MTDQVLRHADTIIRSDSPAAWPSTPAATHANMQGRRAIKQSETDDILTVSQGDAFYSVPETIHHLKTVSDSLSHSHLTHDVYIFLHHFLKLE